MREKIVALALAEIGVKEGSDRHHEYIDDYNTISPLPASYKMTYTVSWCMAFMTWLFLKMGLLELISGGECSCGRMIALAIANGTWVESDSYVPKPGDLVNYDWDDTGSGDCTGWPEHIGMVVSVSGNTYKVIEGNKSDAVGTRTMSVNGKYIRGYVVPKYDESEEIEETTDESEESTKIAEDKRWGCETTSRAQTVFGCKTVDGIVSNQTTWCKTNCHTECSSYSWEWDNGDGGSALIKAIQTYLNSIIGAGLKVDGLCGPATIAAIQKWLGVTVTEKLDGDTVLALQIWLNAQ